MATKKQLANLAKAREAKAAKRGPNIAVPVLVTIVLPAWASQHRQQIQEYFDNAKPGDTLTLQR